MLLELKTSNTNSRLYAFFNLRPNKILLISLHNTPCCFFDITGTWLLLVGDDTYLVHTTNFHESILVYQVSQKMSSTQEPNNSSFIEYSWLTKKNKSSVSAGMVTHRVISFHGYCKTSYYMLSTQQSFDS